MQKPGGGGEGEDGVVTMVLQQGKFKSKRIHRWKVYLQKYWVESPKVHKQAKCLL